MLKDDPQIADQVRGNLRVHLVELLREVPPIYRAGFVKPQSLGLIEDPTRGSPPRETVFLVQFVPAYANSKSRKMTAATILTKPREGRY